MNACPLRQHPPKSVRIWMPHPVYAHICIKILIKCFYWQHWIVFCLNPSVKGTPFTKHPLPGSPDNIRPSLSGGYWVALPLGRINGSRTFVDELQVRSTTIHMYNFYICSNKWSTTHMLDYRYIAPCNSPLPYYLTYFVIILRTHAKKRMQNKRWKRLSIMSRTWTAPTYFILWNDYANFRLDRLWRKDWVIGYYPLEKRLSLLDNLEKAKTCLILALR